MNPPDFNVVFLDHLSFLRQEGGHRKIRGADYLVHSACLLFSKQGYAKTFLEQVSDYSKSGVLNHDYIL